jgi:hypothetical protein|tara:strand:+ start:49 stop:294 length:246 start_codon:yes stop_codon:yes gene_type:complete
MDSIELGNHAKMIITNKAYEEVFSTVKQKYMEALVKTGSHQAELRETLYNTIVALTDVKKEIESLAQAGDNATFTKEKEDL